MKCRKCNSSLNQGQKFCAECGEKVILNCANCNSVLKVEQKFCPECGIKIVSSNTIIENDHKISHQQRQLTKSEENKHIELMKSLEMYSDDKVLEEISEDFFLLGRVYDGEKWGYRDKENNLVIPFMYESVSAFVISAQINGKPIAIAKLNGKEGIIDIDNNIVFPFVIHSCIDELTALRDHQPGFAINPTKECSGWGRIFLNANFDVRFDMMSKEKFYNDYPEGKKWIEDNIHYLGSHWVNNDLKESL